MADVSQEEAKNSLVQIEECVNRMKKSIAAGCADTILMVWGGIWFLAFMGTHFWPHYAGRIWLVLDGIGILLSFILGYTQSPVKNFAFKSFALFWAALFGYGFIWLTLFQPCNRYQVSAFICTLVMFAYVIIGLFWDRFMLWLGLGVTIIVLLGFYLFQPWFWIWMAILGGGTLAGTGIYIRFRWR